MLRLLNLYTGTIQKTTSVLKL